VDLWAQIVIPLVTLLGGWFGNSWKYRHDRQLQLVELRQQSEELDETRREARAEIEQYREQDDRAWIDKAAELCRSESPQDREHGRGFLLGLAAMGNTNPRVVELLDQVTQLELGQTVEEIREAKREEGVTVEVVEEVLVSADELDGSEDGGEEVNGGPVEA
jgi:hypothetical protein